MFGGLIFVPRHQTIIKQIYKNGNVDEQKLSYLIHYLKSKTERIPKVLKYLHVRTLKEIQKTNHITVSAHIITEIIKELKIYSINYETEIIKIFLSLIKHILKNKKKFIFKENEDFLNVFDYFFVNVEIKTFKSEKNIKKILRIITKVIMNLDVTGEYKENDMYSDDSEQVANKPTYVEDSTSDESISMFLETQEVGLEFDYFFLALIQSLIKIKDLFYTEYQEKYEWLINTLIKAKDGNQNKRLDILIELTKNTNILNASCFIYLVLLYSSKLCSTEVDYDVLEKEKDAQDMPQSIYVGAIDMLLLYLPKNTLSFIFIQSNHILINLSQHLMSVKEDCSFTQEQKQCMIIINWSSRVLKETSITNTIELSRSVFALLKTVFHQNVRKKKSLTPNEVIEKIEDKVVIKARPNILFEYIRFFFKKINNVSEVFYLFVKKSFQYDFLDKNKTDSNLVLTVYSRSFQKLILNEIYSFFYTEEAEICDIKLSDLVLRVGAQVSPCSTIAYSIILLLSKKRLLLGRDIKSLTAILAKLRHVFFLSKNEILMKSLLENYHNERIRNTEEGYKILCVLVDSGVCLKEALSGEFIDEKQFLKRYDKDKFEKYDFNEDENKYNEYFKASNRLYNESLRSSMNLEGASRRRRSFINLVDFLKRV